MRGAEFVAELGPSFAALRAAGCSRQPKVEATASARDGSRCSGCARTSTTSSQPAARTGTKRRSTSSRRSPARTRCAATICSGSSQTSPPGASPRSACTALDRISRSVADFLKFFEVLNQYDVEFVCLKQNYDTTSPQGKLFITIMMALAQFEREQAAERTRDATAARADRGLWNGGQLLGYDLDANARGTSYPMRTKSLW
ncbi:MAG: recombinase family protein [Dehalococcoidia bacterium]